MSAWAFRCLFAAAVSALAQQAALDEARKLAAGGDHNGAIAKFQQAADVCRAAADRECEAHAHYGLGRAYTSLARHRDALAEFERTVALRRALDNRVDLGLALHNLAAAHWFLSDNPRAIEVYSEALAVRRAAGDEPGVALTLYGMGASYWAMGDAQPALDSYRDALASFRTTKNAFREADTLNSMGLVYAALGDTGDAVAHYEQALAKWRALGNHAREGYTLSNLGLARAQRGEPRSALDLYRRALPLVEGDTRAVAYVTQNFGEAHAALGEPSQALAYYEKSLALKREIADRFGEAHSLHAIGAAERDLDRLATARQSLQAALGLRREIADAAGEAETLAALASIDRRQGGVDAARRRMEECLDLIESARYEIAASSNRTSFLSSRHRFYEQMVDLLFDADPAAALEASERGRALELLDALGHLRSRVREKIDPRLLERQRAVERRLAQLPSGGGALLEEWEEIEGRIRALSPDYGELTRPPLATVASIRRDLLDGETVLLEYFLGESRSFLWVVTRDALAAHVLPARRAIESAARVVIDGLRSRTPPPALPSARAALSEMLLGPVSTHQSAARLLIVADGVLHYLPFAALPRPSAPARYLVEQSDVISLPSASAAAAIRRREPRTASAGAIAIVADPLFTGELRRLAFSRIEAERIGALVPASRRFVALGADANKARIDRWNGYRVVHLATHAIVDSRHPERSRIVLSQVDAEGRPRDGSLRLWEIYNLRLDAEMIVLSACQTALGQQVRGEGLVGLTRGFFHAGARRVVASLWDVQDRATAELMARFYRNYFSAKLDPAAALRQAQLALLRDPRWSAPYYWAPFVIQGDWGRR